ncbi:MAG: response regulator transcription factor [Chitinophagales bacterium]|nr:response regulator transcription factor [Chitinophagales bacterium]
MTEIKIIIVEDEPIIAADIEAALEKNEFKVSDIAYNMEDAFHSLKNNTPDLAILDINLSGALEGIQIAEIIKSSYQLPFIFLTSYSDKNTLEQAKHTEPSGYLVKPFTEPTLFTTIEIALYNHAQKMKLQFPELSLPIINKNLSTTLSQREFDLLHLIYNGKTNQRIADELFISLNTVKKHINHMYLKLESNSRSTAIARTRQLMMQ